MGGDLKPLGFISSSKKLFLYHFICWTMFISYELFLVYHTFKKIESPVVYIAYYSLNITLFYSIVALLNFTFTRKRNRYFLGIVIFLGLFAGYLIIKSFVDHMVTSPPSTYKNTIGYIQDFFIRNIMRGVYFGILKRTWEF